MLLVAILILFVSVINLNIPYFAIAPGPALDVVELISIDNAPTKRVSGRLLLTTVSLHPIKVGEAIRGWFDPTYEILSRSTIIPSGESEEDADRRSSEQMQESQQNAAAAALTFLGYTVKIKSLGARIRDIDPSAPAKQVLQRGDVIVGADASAVKRSEDLIAVIKRHKVGDEIVLKRMRGATVTTVKTKTIASLDKPSDPIIGVFLDTVPQIELPLAIEIDAGNIGGPSAGLLYAIGIVDLLDSQDLAKGRTVAGTGEISVEGVVGEVGGVEQKIASARHQDADLFLVPSGELKQACGRAGDMPVYAVDHLAEAVRVLRDPAFASKRDCP